MFTIVYFPEVPYNRDKTRDWRENMISSVISLISNFLYGKLLIILLLLGGIYFTVRTRFVQFRLMRRAFEAIMEKPADGDGSVSSFQALMVSTASRVGTGNIVGVSTAICLGGLWFRVLDVGNCCDRRCFCIYREHSGTDL